MFDSTRAIQVPRMTSHTPCIFTPANKRWGHPALSPNAWMLLDNLVCNAAKSPYVIPGSQAHERVRGVEQVPGPVGLALYHLRVLCGVVNVLVGGRHAEVGQQETPSRHIHEHVLRLDIQMNEHDPMDVRESPRHLE